MRHIIERKHLSRTSGMLMTAGLVASIVAPAALGGAASAAPAPKATTASPQVEVLFARGTFESGTLGSVVGPDFTQAVETNLPGVNVEIWGDPYAASADQSSAGPGATDMTDQLESTAASCPGTVYVLGGYSQGASVVDIAIGLKTDLGTGTAIPASLASKVAGVAVWGNPLGLSKQTIAGDSPTYGPKSVSYCNSGDPICGNGVNIFAHLEYGSNGDATNGGVLAADAIKSEYG
jgi:cutinase